MIGDMQSSPWLWHARAIPYMPNFTRGMGIRLHISDHSRFGAAESVSVKSYGRPSEEHPAAAAIFGLRRKVDSGYEKLQMFPGSFMVKSSSRIEKNGSVKHPGTLVLAEIFPSLSAHCLQSDDTPSSPVNWESPSQRCLMFEL